MANKTFKQYLTEWNLDNTSSSLMGIDSSGNPITLDKSSLVPQALKLIESFDDLPTPIGGEIQLVDNVIYQPLFSTPQSSSNTLVFGSNCTWYTPNSNLSIWTYTGSGSALKANDSNSIYIFGMHVLITDPSANLFDFDGNNSNGNLVSERVSSIGGNIGVSRNSLFTFFSECQFISSNNGLLFTGTHSDVSFNTVRFQSYTNNAIDLGTSSINDLLISNTRFIGGSSVSYALSGLTNSGNITQRAIINSSIWNGNGGTLKNITNCDLNYKFSGNSGNIGIGDTNPNATIYIAESGIQETIITAQNDEVVISGTWSVDESRLCQFSSNESGRITYNGLEQITKFVTAKFEGDPSSGNNQIFWFYFRLNGITLDEVSRDTITADANNPVKVVLQSNITFNTGDYIEIITVNKSSGNNITLISPNFIII